MSIIFVKTGRYLDLVSSLNILTLPLPSPHITNYWAISSILKMLFCDKPSCKANGDSSCCNVLWTLSLTFLWVLIFVSFGWSKYHLSGGNVHIKILPWWRFSWKVCAFFVGPYFRLIFINFFLGLFGSSRYEMLHHISNLSIFFILLILIFSVW